MESIFPQNQMNDLILYRLKEIKQLQNDIELGNLEHTTKREKKNFFSKYLLPIIF